MLSVTAIEFCEIYILDYLNLRKYSQINESILERLTETANKRMEMIVQSEDAFKKQLQENINNAAESFVDDV